MATITVPRGDVTPDQVIQALRAALPPRYHVLPGMDVAFMFGAPRPDQPDAIVVGTGSDRVWRTQVRIDRHGSQTHIRVTPPGPALIWLINTLGISRKVGRALRNAPGLGRPAAGHETGTAVNK
jgi:hypothetical protein